MKTRVLLFLLAVLQLLSLSSCSTSLESVQEEEKTEETAELKETEADRCLNLIMLGSSSCYYYVEELYALLTERLPEGVDEVRIYNLYYSGCKLNEHYAWWKSGTGKYQLFRTDRNGRKELGSGNWTMEQALSQQAWDYISLQGRLQGKDYLTTDPEEYVSRSFVLAKPMLDRIHSLHPDARLFWHSPWYEEFGRVTSTGYVYTAEDAPKYNENVIKVRDTLTARISEKSDYTLSGIHTCEAWIKARELNESRNLLPYGGLCARLGQKSFGDGRDNAGDGYHDGDIGGGQLLNAYLWYATLTGDTDLAGLTYSPTYHRGGQTYTLTPELIDMLKEAAMSAFQ